VGRELGPKGRTPDFKDKELEHAIPYAVLDLTRDEGWVNVGIDRDTARFAAASIKGWWEHLGCERYPDARSLTITADSGGSNSHRTRLWKVELRKLADAIGPRDDGLPRPARNQQVERCSVWLLVEV
jgi:Rhodopirellula transposase DDE domain